MSERCPTCGQRVTGVSDPEGTSHYEGVAEREVAEHAERIEVIEGLLATLGEKFETWARVRSLLAPSARVNEEDGA